MSAELEGRDLLASLKVGLRRCSRQLKVSRLLLARKPRHFQLRLIVNV